MHVLPIGIGRGEQRAEEAIERGERLGHVRGERQIGLVVVADREHVALGAQEPVHPAAVELGPAAVPGVVGVEEPAALVVVGEPVVAYVRPSTVGEAQAGLAAVGSGQPAEVVVERPVLHHQHDERVDRQVARRGDGPHPLAPSRLGDDRVRIEHEPHPGGEPGRARRALEEVAPGVEGVRGDRLEALGLPGIAEIVHGPAHRLPTLYPAGQERRTKL